MSKLIDVEGMLAKLAEIRASMPLGAGVPPPREEGVLLDLDAQTADDFERAAVADALESMAAELRAEADAAMTRAYEQALDVYYAAEDMARDPGHAHLAAQVEAMRSAHESTYGRPIPPRVRRTT